MKERIRTIYYCLVSQISSSLFHVSECQIELQCDIARPIINGVVGDARPARDGGGQGQGAGSLHDPLIGEIAADQGNRPVVIDMAEREPSAHLHIAILLRTRIEVGRGNVAARKIGVEIDAQFQIAADLVIEIAVEIA